MISSSLKGGPLLTLRRRSNLARQTESLFCGGASFSGLSQMIVRHQFIRAGIALIVVSAFIRLQKARESVCRSVEDDGEAATGSGLLFRAWPGFQLFPRDI
jgi:hypothetical protein